MSFSRLAALKKRIGYVHEVSYILYEYVLTSFQPDCLNSISPVTSNHSDMTVFLHQSSFIGRSKDILARLLILGISAPTKPSEEGPL